LKILNNTFLKGCIDYHIESNIELSIHQKNPDFFFYHSQQTQLLRSTTVFNIDNNRKCFL